MVSSNLVADARQQVAQMIEGAVGRAMAAEQLPAGDIPTFVVEIPQDVSHGDFATNIAMVGARQFRMAPAKIAQILLEQLDFSDTYFVRAEMAGPGFLNFFLSEKWFVQVLQSIAHLGDRYGHTDFGGGKKVMVEFVSANPTGPMHMGNARGGAIGDCLVAAMRAAGYDVHSEFYVNDAGNQVEKLGISLEVRYLQHYLGQDAVPFPEDGYKGEDITQRALEFAEIHGDAFVQGDSQLRRDKLVDYALPRNIEALKNDLHTYRIDYDVWFRESSLYTDGTVEMVLDKLREKNLTYHKEGAEWYKATEFGAEKDEVLVRANGHCTYFAADIAYHYNKFAMRGFDQVIDVWGADHHGHVARLKGAMDAVGLSGDKLDIVLMQLVRLVKDGEPYRMSKRSGKSVTLSDLLELVPIDAARFFFNMREPGSAMDFDLDLAVDQTAQNPVYYVQYAHARICSIVKKLEQEGTVAGPAGEASLELLTQPEEIELIRKLAQCPGEIIGASVRYDPACMTHYVMEVATQFHKFYNACRVGVEDVSLRQARLWLCLCTRTVLANMLGILKINAPETM